MRAILIILLFASGFAEAREIVWHRGSVVLASKEVIVGDVARQSFELLLLKTSDGNVTVYPAHKVSSFRYYDEQENVNRVFVTMANKYYERVVRGKISVFRIQKFFSQEIDEKHPQFFDFFIEEQKTVYSLKSFRNKFYDRIRDELDVNLVSYDQLDPNTSHGALSLIILYNRSLESRTVQLF